TQTRNAKNKMSYPGTGRRVSRTFYGKNGEVLEDPIEQLLNLHLQINDIRADQHERISNLEEQVNKQKEINKFLKAYSDRMATGLEDLRDKTWQLEDTIEALKLRIGNLEQPDEPSDHPDSYTYDQQSNTGYSTDEEEGTWEVDYEPSEQEKSNYQRIWEFLTDSIDDINQDNDTSWYAYQDLTNLLDDQEDDDLDYDETQNPKTPQEAIENFLQLAKNQGVLTKKQHKQLVKRLT
ncbi:hypothetical protein FRC10_001951, partial [Ceratobasidium sp. 414]